MVARAAWRRARPVRPAVGEGRARWIGGPRADDLDTVSSAGCGGDGDDHGLSLAFAGGGAGY
uniref:Uncharacterized protein n=1 Tax=Oryza glumipatula TaxID=40148 RepID=A0A0D9YFY9_9ORYZ